MASKRRKKGAPAVVISIGGDPGKKRPTKGTRAQKMGKGRKKGSRR